MKKILMAAAALALLTVGTAPASANTIPGEKHVHICYYVFVPFPHILCT